MWFARSAHQLLIRVGPYWQALIAFIEGAVGSFCRAAGLVGIAHRAGGMPTLGMRHGVGVVDIKKKREVYAGGEEIIQAPLLVVEEKKSIARSIEDRGATCRE